MDYEMMVKCAYEEIVGGIEKEAGDYTPEFSSLLPGQRDAIKSIAGNVSRSNRVFGAIESGIKRSRGTLDSANESVRKYSNALEGLKARGVQSGAPAFQKVQKGLDSAKSQADKANRMIRNLNAFNDKIVDAL